MPIITATIVLIVTVALLLQSRHSLKETRKQISRYRREIKEEIKYKLEFREKWGTAQTEIEEMKGELKQRKFFGNCTLCRVSGIPSNDLYYYYVHGPKIVPNAVPADAHFAICRSCDEIISSES